MPRRLDLLLSTFPLVVVACVTAEVGVSVSSIDLFGPMPNMSSATAAELDTYAAQEGVFFGNLFLDAPIASACALDVIAPDDFRACQKSTSTCGVLKPLTKLNTKGWGGLVLQDCYRDSVCLKASLGGGDYYATSCRGAGRTWSYPVTTRLLAADAGDTCFGTYQCMRGLDCVSEICQ